ncbi:MULTISPECIES: hypothetical protein [Catenuloplanes]|uniref:Uncharacterized protein n=1 Tax=Catenuloplanes niger TaxID=587534 RepID=A0AAE4CXQ4_9ACTN|nr:hypothetical protein [Catenuloplanes niger]MDR7326833.1 hypothetical protein [Catenuloplanes niger]
MRTFLPRYGPGGVILAVLAALVGGVLAAAPANRLAWNRASPPWPWHRSSRC